jgi:predicted chitinase
MITTLVLGKEAVREVLRDCGVYEELADAYAPELLNTAQAYQITTPDRFIGWLTCILYASNRLEFTEELGTGSAYEGNKWLGNTEEGDGPRFKARGLLPLVGRRQYLRYAQHRKEMELMERPELLSRPPWSIDSAGWLWRKGLDLDMNALLDRHNQEALLRLVFPQGVTDFFKRTHRFVERGVRQSGEAIVMAKLNGSGLYPEVTHWSQIPSIVRDVQSDQLMTNCHGLVDEATWKVIKKWGDA